MLPMAVLLQMCMKWLTYYDWTQLQSVNYRMNWSLNAPTRCTHGWNWTFPTVCRPYGRISTGLHDIHFSVRVCLQDKDTNLNNIFSNIVNDLLSSYSFRQRQYPIL